MSFCIKIYARQCPPCLPDSAYDSDGRVCLDTIPTEKYSKSKTVTELSQFGKIKSSTVRQFSLPATARNRAILKSYGSVTALNFDNFTLVPVTVFEGSSAAQESFISISKKQPSFDRWNVSLTSGGESWTDGIGNCYLCDLDLGLFELTKDNLQSAWLADNDGSFNNNNAPYQDGDQGIAWPLVHYGGWTVPAVYDEDGNLTESTYATAGDFRPWIFLLKILQDGFCKLGYKLKAPIFETEWGRRLIIYGLDDLTSLQKDKDILHVGYTPDPMQFVSAADQNYIAFGNQFQIFTTWLVPFDNESAPFFDAGAAIGDGYYNLSNNCIEKIGGTYCFEVCMDLLISEPTEQIVIWLTIDEPMTSPGSNAIPSQYITLAQGEHEDVCYTFDNVEVPPGSTVKVSIDFITTFSQLLAVVGVRNVELKVKQKSINYAEGAILDIASLLDCSCTLEDILAGALHLIGGGKIITNHLTKETCIYPPENIETPTRTTGVEFVEGYFLPKTKAIDMRDRIVKNSECVTIERDGKNRFINFCFGDNDAYLESQGFGDESKPYSSTVDLGAENGFIEDSDDNCNPTFDGTGTIIADDINLSNDDRNSIEIPALWDNTDNEISWDLKKRILIYQGYTSQRGLPDPQNPDNVGFNFWSCQTTPGGTVQTGTQAPIAYQESNYGYLFGEQNNLAVTYDNESEFNQIEFYKREILNAGRGLGSQYLFMLNNCDYKDIDFRRAFYFEYNGKPQYFWPTQIQDFRSCENIPTPVTGYPENKQLIICPQINIPPYCSQSIFPLEGGACDWLTDVPGTFITGILTNEGLISGSQFDLVAPDLCVTLGNMLGGTWSNNGGQFSGYLFYEGPVIIRQINFSYGSGATNFVLTMEQVECP